jgi:hypothetical protein
MGHQCESNVRNRKCTEDFSGKPFGKRSHGRPISRWEDMEIGHEYGRRMKLVCHSRLLWICVELMGSASVTPPDSQWEIRLLVSEIKHAGKRTRVPMACSFNGLCAKNALGRKGLSLLRHQSHGWLSWCRKRPTQNYTSTLTMEAPCSFQRLVTTYKTNGVTTQKTANVLEGEDDGVLGCDAV